MIGRLVCWCLGHNERPVWHPSGAMLLCVRCHTATPIGEPVNEEPVFEPTLYVPAEWTLSPIKEEHMQHVSEPTTLVEECDRCIQFARVAIDVGESQLLLCMHHYAQHLTALEEHEAYVIHHHPSFEEQDNS